MDTHTQLSYLAQFEGLLRRVARATLFAAAALLLVGASISAQSSESRLAHQIAPTRPRSAPARPGVAGGWPSPIEPALLLAASIGVAFAATRIHRSADGR